MSALSQTNEKLSEHLEEAGDRVRRVHEATASVIFGQDRVIELTLITLLSGGHALLIGVPGLAKTSLVETLGTVLGKAGYADQQGMTAGKKGDQCQLDYPVLAEDD